MNTKEEAFLLRWLASYATIIGITPVRDDKTIQHEIDLAVVFYLVSIK
ncbi:MAG: hypothetical protein ACOC6B_03900 [Thermodesulfobacteriota bacterium]